MQFCLFMWPQVNKTNTHTNKKKRNFSLQISLLQGSTQRTSLCSPASNWPRRDYHHGNSKGEELHSTDQDRGHCCPGNKPSNTRTTCGRNPHYTSEPISVLDTCTHLLLLILIGIVCTCTHYIVYLHHGNCVLYSLTSIWQKRTRNV